MGGLWRGHRAAATRGVVRAVRRRGGDGRAGGGGGGGGPGGGPPWSSPDGAPPWSPPPMEPPHSPASASPPITAVSAAGWAVGLDAGVTTIAAQVYDCYPAGTPNQTFALEPGAGAGAGGTGLNLQIECGNAIRVHFNLYPSGVPPFPSVRLGAVPLHAALCTWPWPPRAWGHCG